MRNEFMLKLLLVVMMLYPHKLVLFRNLRLSAYFLLAYKRFLFLLLLKASREMPQIEQCSKKPYLSFSIACRTYIYITVLV